MRKPFTTTRLMVSVALPLMFLASTAHAQEAEATADDQGLSEIVVTAQKRAENLQDVPLAVTAVSGDTLKAAAVSDTQQLTALVPGLQVRTTAGSFQPAIRGIGTSSSVVENPVALYIDGVYLPQQREGLRELNDIEQVAVLKGPQGTLFGRNATGGVIQITTKAPSHEFKGEAGASIDNYALFKSDLYLTGGLGENAAASISAFYSKQGEGWGDNLTNGHDTFKLRHEFSVRGKLLFEPGPDTSITIAGDYLDRDALTNSFQNYPGTQLTFVQLAPLKNVHDSYAGADSFVKFKGGGASLTIDHDFGFAKLLSISAYRKGKGDIQFDNTGAPGAFFVVQVPNAPNESYSQEIQLISPKSEFSWVVGAYYFHNLNGAKPIRRIITGPLAPAPTSTTLNSTFGTETAESLAPFGQIDWEFVTGTTLTLGARYTYEKRSVDSTTTLTRVNGTQVLIPRIESDSIRKPTFRVALSHQLSDDVMAYVAFNSGFKSGGYNVINPANAAYLPETLKAYEAGFKSEFLDRRVRLNASAFYYDYGNVQITQFVSGVQSISNGAAAKLYGLDVDFEARLGAEFRLSGGFLIEHSEFTNFPNATFSTPRPTGGASLFPGDAKGNRLPLAQEFVGTLGIDWSHDLESGGAIDANVTANYNGDYFFEPDNFARQGDFVFLNASIKYTFPGKRFSVMAFGKNLLDEEVRTQPSSQGIGYPTTYGSPPRTYGIAARVQF